MKTFKQFVAESDDTPEANKKFAKGDIVKDVYGEKSQVISINHPMVLTDKGNYHHTKVFKQNVK